MRTLIAFFTAALVGLTSGCGTVANLASDRPEVYGGVIKDVEFLATPGTRNSGDVGGTAVLLALWAADLCACGVADTVTIPVLYFRNRHAKERFDPTGVLEETLRP